MKENEWLLNEITALRMERIKKKQPKVFIYALIFMTMFTAVIAYDTNHPIQTLRWSKTWKCGRCGHENYEEIKTCPICGTVRGRK